MVIWLVPRLLDEHRSALDWLNERTDERSHFFGVVVSVVRIGDSRPAPVFTVEVRPNDWQKSARAATASTGSPWGGWEIVYRALAMVKPGEWTTVQDLASLAGTSPAWISRHMYAEQDKHPGIHRMLAKDGVPWQWLKSTDGSPRPSESVQEQLAGEGVIFDAAGRAGAAQHIDAQLLESRLAAPNTTITAAPQPDMHGNGTIG